MATFQVVPEFELRERIILQVNLRVVEGVIDMENETVEKTKSVTKTSSDSPSEGSSVVVKKTTTVERRD